MKEALHAWRDTLRDLGAIGLIPELTAPIQERTPPLSEDVRSGPATRMEILPAPQTGHCPSPESVAAATTLPDLEAAISGCMACPLGGGRIRLVFGDGNPSAELMFIGEGPGQEEDIQGKPFVGKAGGLLDKMIEAIGLRRGEVYIANIVKCRPPDNRTPTDQEARQCLGYLKRQIDLIQPKVIVTLGGTPLRELLGISIGITKIRGQWQRFEGIPVMPTFHPSYVLRQYTPSVRRWVWEDLKAAKEWVDGARTR